MQRFCHEKLKNIQSVVKQLILDLIKGESQPSMLFSFSQQHRKKFFFHQDSPSINLNPRLEKTIVTNTKTSRTEQSTQDFDILNFHSLNIFPESKSPLYTFLQYCIIKINMQVNNAYGFKQECTFPVCKAVTIPILGLNNPM